MPSPALHSVLALSILLSLGAPGCSSGAKDSTATASPAKAPTIVGDWVTEETPSALGTIVTRYRFGKDGDFHGRIEVVNKPTPPIVVSGTYVVHGNTLDTKIDDERRASTFRFENGELILEQYGSVLRFHRK